MGSREDKDEEILNKLVSARNSIVMGKKQAALETLVGIQKELHNFRGSDRAYFILLNSYDLATKCASSDQGPAEIKKSPVFGEFQKYLGFAVEIIQPEGMTDLDDLSATRPY